MKDAVDEIDGSSVSLEILARHYATEDARVQELRNNAKLVLDFIPVLMKANDHMDAREAEIKLAGLCKALQAFEPLSASSVGGAK
jgi:hypothetical protein